MSASVRDRLFAIRRIYCGMLAPLVVIGALAALAHPPEEPMSTFAARAALIGLAVFGLMMLSAMRAFARERARNTQGRLAPLPADEKVFVLCQRYHELRTVLGMTATGWGMAGTVLFIFSGLWWSLIAPVIAMAILVMTWPTAGRYLSWSRQFTGGPDDESRVQGPSRLRSP